jgi:translation initiation factor 1
MAKKNKKKKKIDTSGEGGFVFSTNNDFIDEIQNHEDEDDEPIDKSTLRLKIWLEKKGRAGKTATIVRGLEEHGSLAFQYASELKSYCSCGGSLKMGEIILQGDVRDKTIAFFDKEGIKAVKAGG